MKVILKCIVGSVAHGLNTPDSDTDYRGVFYVSTADLMKLGKTTQNTNWIEENVDDTSWEIGRFLDLATHCNPTILETFLAPFAELADPTKGIIRGDYNMEDLRWGEEMRGLFPDVWNSTDVMNAFIGYGLNQRKKFLDAKDKRPQKFACAYLRTLYQAQELLNTGTFTVRVAETEVGDTLKRWKSGDWGLGEVMETCAFWENKVREAYNKNPNKKTDLDKINDFLVRFRKAHWDI